MGSCSTARSRMVRIVRIHLEGIESDMATLRSDMPAMLKPSNGTKNDRKKMKKQEILAVGYGKLW